MTTAGIPLATSITSIVTFAVLMWLLEREMGGLYRGWLVDGAARMLVASGVSVLLAWCTWSVLDDWLGRSTIAQVASVGGSMIAGLVAYLAAARCGVDGAASLYGLGISEHLDEPVRVG